MAAMPGFVLVAAGGALGSVLRYGASLAAMRWLPGRIWPWATLAVNLAGCLAIGWILAGLRESAIPEPVRLFVVTGMLGGLTTFSTFGAETFSMAESGHWGLAGGYAAASLVGGLLAVWAGFALHR